MCVLSYERQERRKDEVKWNVNVIVCVFVCISVDIYLYMTFMDTFISFHGLRVLDVQINKVIFMDFINIHIHI